MHFAFGFRTVVRIVLYFMNLVTFAVILEALLPSVPVLAVVSHSTSCVLDAVGPPLTYVALITKS